jgi:hypothetical protein
VVGATAKCAATGSTIGSARRSAKPLANAHAAKMKKTGTSTAPGRQASRISASISVAATGTPRLISSQPSAVTTASSSMRMPMFQ